MPKSTLIRPSDIREMTRLIGECRELGDDAGLWRGHAIGRLARLTGSMVGSCSELAGFRSLRLRLIDPTDWGWPTESDRACYYAGHARLTENPSGCASLLAYHRCHAREDGICVSRVQLFTNRQWSLTEDYQTCHRPVGLNNVLWCIRSLPHAGRDTSFGISLMRARGGRTFGARERALVGSMVASLAPMLGGPLSRSGEPSPADLAPQVRRVLRCLLEGDSDKQIAARMLLSPHTVNQYTKVIFRHFGVRGRSELMARWIRRGWGGAFVWAD